MKFTKSENIVEAYCNTSPSRSTLDSPELREQLQRLYLHEHTYFYRQILAHTYHQGNRNIYSFFYKFTYLLHNSSNYLQFWGFPFSPRLCCFKSESGKGTLDKTRKRRRGSSTGFYFWRFKRRNVRINIILSIIAFNRVLCWALVFLSWI